MANGQIQNPIAKSEVGSSSLPLIYKERGDYCVGSALYLLIIPSIHPLKFLSRPTIEVALELPSGFLAKVHFSTLGGTTVSKCNPTTTPQLMKAQGFLQLDE